MHRLVSRRLLIISLLLLFCLGNLAYAQTDCADPEATLRIANDEFDKGHFFNVPDLLLTCLQKNNFSRQQQERAYLLLVQTYLILEDHKNADDNYLKLLTANPEFETQLDRDPVDLVYLSRKFTATPIFSWYVNAGTAFAKPNVLVDNFAIDNSNQKYSLGFGWLAGGGIIWNANERITAELALNFLSQSFILEQSNIFVNDLITINERYSSASAPITVKYMLTKKQKYWPYVGVGFTTNLWLSGNQDITFKNRSPIFDSNDAQVGFTSQETSKTIQLDNRREPVNFQIHVSGGVKYKYRLNYFFAELTYGVGLINTVKRNSLIADSQSNNPTQPSFSVAHVDDYFTLNNIQLNAGFIKPLYKPRKLKNAKTKSVTKALKKPND